MTETSRYTPETLSNLEKFVSYYRKGVIFFWKYVGAATILGLESKMTPGRFEAICSNNMVLFLISLHRTLEMVSYSTIVL